MKSLKLFSDVYEYESWIETDDYVIPNMTYCENEKQIFINDVSENIDWSKRYLTFHTLEDSDFRVSDCLGPIYYSLNNGETWLTLPSNTSTIIIPANYDILFKGTLLNVTER